MTFLITFCPDNHFPMPPIYSSMNLPIWLSPQAVIIYERVRERERHTEKRNKYLLRPIIHFMDNRSPAMLAPGCSELVVYSEYIIFDNKNVIGKLKLSSVLLIPRIT